MTDISNEMEQAVWEARKRIHAAFTEDGFPPVEASADDLVTVTIDARCRLTAVSLHGAGLDPTQRQRLEAAIVTAVSNGTRQVAQRQAERLAKIVKGAAG